MAEYIEIFPDSFVVSVAMLNDSHHWVDAGSGEGHALAEFMQNESEMPQQFLPNSGASWFRKTQIHFDEPLVKKALRVMNARELDEKPQITGVTYHMSSKRDEPSRINFKVGKFFEDIPIEEIRKADLITDLFGVMSYSPRIDEVLSRYHALLKPNAKAYIFVGDYLEVPFYTGFFKKQNVGEAGWFSNFGISRVRKRNGEEVPLLDWISSLSGFNSRIESRRLSQPPAKGVKAGVVERRTLVLEKNGEPLRIPRLRLVDSDGDKPPFRVFEEIE